MLRCLSGSSLLLCVSVKTWQASWLFQQRLVENTSCSVVVCCLFVSCCKSLFSPQQLKNKKGLIPSNFVEEVAVASPRRLAAAKVNHFHDPVTVWSPSQPLFGSFRDKWRRCFSRVFPSFSSVANVCTKSCCRHQTSNSREKRVSPFISSSIYSTLHFLEH